MTCAKLYWILSGIIVVALVMRVAALWTYPGLHPDEFFQYLEPAWWHLHGYGCKAWEWKAKLRSWVLPTYYGSWMVLLSWVGVRSGAAAHWFFQLHWSVISAACVWFGWRAGCAMAAKGAKVEGNELPVGWRSGLLAAAFCAAMPVLVHFSPHTAAEIPAMLAMLWGFTLWVELRANDDSSFSKAFATGVLLCLGACIRIPWGPLALIPAVDWLVRRRFKMVGALALGAVPPLMVFGIADWVTWGIPFESAWAFVDHNFFQGKAAAYGRQGHWWYLTTIGQRLGIGLLVVIPLLLYGVRRIYPWLVPAILAVTYLSTQVHQEERFILIFWPMIAASLGTSLGHLLSQYTCNRLWRTYSWPVAAALVVFIFICNAAGISTRERFYYDGWHGLRAGQAWAGAQPDISGLLVSRSIYLTGGYLVLGKNVPQQPFHSYLLSNLLFNYCVLKSDSEDLKIAKRNGFEPLWQAHGFVVVRRSRH